MSLDDFNFQYFKVAANKKASNSNVFIENCYLFITTFVNIVNLDITLYTIYIYFLFV